MQPALRTRLFCEAATQRTTDRSFQNTCDDMEAHVNFVLVFQSPTVTSALNAVPAQGLGDRRGHFERLSSQLSASLRQVTDIG